jgi:uncharacterized membrane protein
MNDKSAQIDFNSIISLISSFTIFLKCSTQKAAVFPEMTIEMMGQKIVLVNDVSALWNSTWNMLRRAYSL